MRNYSSEEVFLEENKNGILYGDENELGSHYIINYKGVFMKYSFRDGTCTGYRSIDFNEFFKYYSKGMRMPLSVCKVLRIEIIFVLFITLLINIKGTNLAEIFRRTLINSSPIINVCFIVSISFCIVEIIFNSRSYIAELCRKVLQILLVIKLGESVILLVGGTTLAKGVVIFLVGFYIIASIAVVNMKINLDSMYRDLELKFLK